MREALFYAKTETGLRCELCPHHCLIGETETGLCGVRGEYNGKLYALGYGRLSAENIDPIEKKPQYMFMPGTKTYSIGSFGCNMRCPFCQNFSIARSPAIGYAATPEQIVKNCARTRCPTLSYTYNEPFTQYEFMYDVAKLAKQAGLGNVVVTNGCVEREPLDELLPLIDAMNIDVKSAQDDVYAAELGGDLDAVLHTLHLAAARCHVEVTALMAPGICDIEDVAAIAGWISEIKASIPLHITRYFPAYQYDLPATPLTDMREARRIAMELLPHVFLGNVD